MARPARPPQPQRRDGYWYFTRRVPYEFKHIEPRPRVFKTTGIAIADDPHAVQARIAIEKLNTELTQFWMDKRAGRDPNLRLGFEEAIETCNGLSRARFEHDRVRLVKTQELVERLRQLNETVESDYCTAVPGPISRPWPMLSSLRLEGERYLLASLEEKAEKQLDRWRNARDSALRTFIDVIGGDRRLGELTRQDALSLRDHWERRVAVESFAIDTANKNIGRVVSLFDAVNKQGNLGLDNIFDGVRRIVGKDNERRIKYDTDFLQDRFLADGMFDGVNEEARRAIYLLVETGLRPSEAVNLNQEAIILDAQIPHVVITPERNTLKSQKSPRRVPLVGVSLMAMQAQKKGFPRYRGKQDSFSTLINKVLDSRQLRPAGKLQSLCSIRHSFRDRLIAAKCSLDIVNELMGHGREGIHFRGDSDLEIKLDWLRKIELKPPLTV